MITNRSFLVEIAERSEYEIRRKNVEKKDMNVALQLILL